MYCNRMFAVILFLQLNVTDEQIVKSLCDIFQVSLKVL